MIAAILAGGKGTRLGALTRDLPKPLVEIGGEPLLAHQLRLLARHGFRDVALLTGHRGEAIRDRLGDGSGYGVRLRYLQDRVPLGTAGALRAAGEELGSEFLLLFGDVMISMDLEAFAAFHRARGASCTVAVHPNDHPHDSDLVEMDRERRVTAVHPKPHEPGRDYRNFVAAGAYVLTSAALRHVEPGVASDLGREALARIAACEPVYAYLTAEYLKDMGTPERLERVRRDFDSGRIARMHRSRPRPAVFLDRDGVINAERGPICSPGELELIPGSGEAIRRLNATERLTFVVSNQAAIAKGKCSFETLEAIHRRLDTELGRAGARIDTLYYCPHHPEGGHPGEVAELKIQCSCRKPGTGMIEQACVEHSVDLAASWIVGDSGRDIACGKGVGLATIGVRTGHGCRDISADPAEQPDFMVEDLAEAVGLILGEDAAPGARAVAERALAHAGPSPCVIAVAGNSRSGKSTLAARVARRLAAAGKRVLRVPLDHWIIPAAERADDGTVFGRYRMLDLGRDVESLLAGRVVRLSPYDAARRGPDPARALELKLEGQEVVLIEGVVALSSPEIRSRADLRVFCTADGELLRERFMRFYRWKGMPREEAERLFAARERDEYRLIEREAARADLVVRADQEGES